MASRTSVAWVGPGAAGKEAEEARAEGEDWEMQAEMDGRGKRVFPGGETSGTE